MPENKTPSKGKGKILGMPYWAAGLALALGLLAGYFILRKSGGSSSDTSSSDQTAQQPQDQGGGGGGGIPPFSLPNLSALGLTPPQGQEASSGSQNENQQIAPNPTATFAAAVDYAHSQFSQGGAPLNQSAIDYAHSVINVPQVASAPAPVPSYNPTSLLITGHGSQ